MQLTLVACECGRADCAELIEVDPRELRELHDQGSRAIAPGHISGSADEVVVANVYNLPEAPKLPSRNIVPGLLASLATATVLIGAVGRALGARR